MARAAFRDRSVVAELSLFVPVIVDGDREKGVLRKYGVRSFPTVKFTDATGKVITDLMARNPGGVIASAKKTAAEVKPHITHRFRKLAKARSRLDKAVAQRDIKNALAAIKEMEAVGHRGADMRYANFVEERFRQEAKLVLARARELMATDPKTAKKALRSLIKQCQGLPEAVQAKKLLKST